MHTDGDIHARGEHDNTVLHFATGYATDADILDKLMDAGADLSAQHRLPGTALHIAAAFNENPDMIRVLARAEVDVATLGERLQREAEDGNCSYSVTPPSGSTLKPCILGRHHTV